MSGIVGIMGGTFNPVHNGHIAIAKAAHEQFNIPYILVMPSYSPAYKDNSNIVSARHRCNMVNLAIRLTVALIFAPRFGIEFVWLAVPAGWLANFLISYMALRKSWPVDKTIGE